MTQEEIDGLFAEWIGSFGFTGGCEATDSDLSGYSAPDACGGEVTVNYSASDECQEDSCSSTFTVVAIPPSCTASAGDSGVYNQCYGGEITLHVEGSGCRTPFTYEWSTPDSGSLDLTDPENPVYTGGSIGDHDFTVTVTDADGCTSTCNVSVTIITCLEECETAFGVQTYTDGGLQYVDDDMSSCFRNDGFNRWGWVNYIPEPGTYELEMYRGAGRCDLSKGTYVGTVTVHYGDGATVNIGGNDYVVAAGKVVVTFDLLDDPQYVMSEGHVWLDCDKFPTTKNGSPTVAPGQYNFNATELSETNTKNVYSTPAVDADGGFYFIAHAVVCTNVAPEGSELPGAPEEGGIFEPAWPDTAMDCNVNTDTWGKMADFKAYPVPFDNEVNVSYKFDYDTKVTIDVYDIKGALIRTSVNNNYVKGSVERTTIDLSKADNQMYFVRLTTDKGTEVKKIVSSGLNKQ
jgi:hypothetical protein